MWGGGESVIVELIKYVLRDYLFSVSVCSFFFWECHGTPDQLLGDVVQTFPYFLYGMEIA